MRNINTAQRRIYTLGYEGRDANAVFGILQTASIRTLLDVRLRPQSRRPGLSKSRLAEKCAELGITYVHDRDLGTPREMMDRVKSGDGYDEQIHEEYRRYLLSTQAEPLKSAGELALSSSTCLLCYELDAENCHRSIVAEELARQTGLTVHHL